MLDGNEVALAKYLDEQEKAEKRYSAFIEEVTEIVDPLIIEAKEAFDALCEKYELEESFESFIEDVI